MHTVDLMAEAGFGKILHKWVEIDIRDDVAYLNGTMVITFHNLASFECI